MGPIRSDRLLATGLIVSLTLVAAACSKAPSPVASSTSASSAPAPSASTGASDVRCDPIKTVPPFNPESEDRAHIGAPPVLKPPPLQSYSSMPAASGPHAPVPLGAGIYKTPPDPYATIHSLEHGAVIVWLSPDASPEAVHSIQSFFSDPLNGDHTLVAPYDYPDQHAALPEPAHMALLAWHHIQLCDEASLVAAKNFAAQYRFPTLGGGPYLGDAPEQGLPI
jgi:hypothetical protein